MASESAVPRITFGMIVLNGEPFLRYNLRAIYPFAQEIIVVEGASQHAYASATTGGHSLDRTLAILHEFKENEDPGNKVILVQAEDDGYPNGFWPGEKEEQSQAYAKRTTGDWLWQVDVDEFYMPEDMAWICGSLLPERQPQAVSFKQVQFWGGLNYFTDGWYLRHYGGEVFHRLFRWKPEYSYASHRPPTVLDESGRDLRQHDWVGPNELARRHIFLYHYSLVFPQQVQRKSDYYATADWGDFARMSTWAQSSFEELADPYHVHNVYAYPSWLERYRGNHPPQVMQMWQDVVSAVCDPRQEVRPTEDIERLLRSPSYFCGKALLKIAGPFVFGLLKILRRLLRLVPKTARNALRAAIMRPGS